MLGEYPRRHARRQLGRWQRPERQPQAAGQLERGGVSSTTVAAGGAVSLEVFRQRQQLAVQEQLHALVKLTALHHAHLALARGLRAAVLSILSLSASAGTIPRCRSRWSISRRARCSQVLIVPTGRSSASAMT